MILLALTASAVSILALGMFIGAWLGAEHGRDSWQRFNEACDLLLKR